MKRPATKIVLFLLLGAIINVAVAWVFMFRTSYNQIEKEFAWADAEDLSWPAEMPSDWPKPWSCEAGIATGFRFVSADSGREEESESRYVSEDWSATRIDVGWPLYSLASLASSHDLFDSSQAYDAEDASLPDIDVTVDPRRLPARSIPYRPLWPGFAINTMFYAAVLWLPFAAFGRIRRRRRLKRGLCPACAYPVGTNPRCTECGKPVTPS